MSARTKPFPASTVGAPSDTPAIVGIGMSCTCHVPRARTRPRSCNAVSRCIRIGFGRFSDGVAGTGRLPAGGGFMRSVVYVDVHVARARARPDQQSRTVGLVHAHVGEDKAVAGL